MVVLVGAPPLPTMLVDILTTGALGAREGARGEGGGEGGDNCVETVLKQSNPKLNAAFNCSS